MVFFTHGRTGSIVTMYWRCRELRDLGLIVVGLDQRNHGQRQIDIRCNAGWGPATPADMYGILVGTAMDVSLLIDLLPARLGIATDRVGMSGISLGGHATLLAMSLEMRIGVGAAIVGSGDFRTLMQRPGPIAVAR